MTTFLRLLDVSVDAKPTELLCALQALREPEAVPRLVFERDPTAFSAVPGSPFAYWVSETIRATFTNNPRFENLTTDRAARQGGVTGDDFRWFRLWTEVQETSFSLGARPRCTFLAKGGRYSRYYGPMHLVVQWDDVRNTFWSFTGLPHRPSLQPASAGYYFRPGLTWPLRTNGLSFRAMPVGCVFGHKGPTAFINSDSINELLALNIILNSQIFGYLISIQLARTELAQSYEVGLIQQTPVPDLSDSDKTILARLARRAWSLKRSLDTTNETSHAFLLPPDVNERLTGLDRAAVNGELGEIQRQIDDEAFRLYGITEEDRAAIERTAKAPRDQEGEAQGDDEDEVEEAEDAEAWAGDFKDFNVYDAFDWSNEFVNSWLVGVAFGRFDPRLATGERPIPPEPGPFDALPARSPGMWPNGEEPADRPDILVGDLGHADDLAGRVLKAGGSLGVSVGENLPGWLAKDFFPLHIKMYSKSRRKAPIYWQLATPSASYSVWLYIHAFSRDTLFRVQNDYALPKLAHEERRLGALTSELQDGATAADRKALAAQEALVDELRAFVDEVKRVAPLWQPNLDDGVILNFAPLWRLVPQNKAWQKELKTAWDALSEGKYDWAHLAMHLWPERVVPKCAKDRSLAIAHDLESVFWAQESGKKGQDGKWVPKPDTRDLVPDLVKARTSPAVKSALKSLLDAPAASGTAKKARKGKANA